MTLLPLYNSKTTCCVHLRVGASVCACALCMWVRVCVWVCACAPLYMLHARLHAHGIALRMLSVAVACNKRQGMEQGRR